MSTVLSRLKHWLGLRFGCPDCHRLLFDYAQGNLDPKSAEKLEQHLKDCPPCLDYIKTYRQTINATKNHCCRQSEMPPELRRKLQEFIAKEM